MFLGLPLVREKQTNVTAKYKQLTEIRVPTSVLLALYIYNNGNAVCKNRKTARQRFPVK